MRLPLSWMIDYVDPQLPPVRLAERLDLTGTEVERIFTHGVSDLRLFYDNDLRFLRQFSGSAA